MKRILVFFLFIAMVIGSIYAWMTLRPVPGNLLKTSLRHLTTVGVTPLQGSIQWEKADQTERNFSFGGWVSYAGMLDLRDLSSIRGNGMIGYSSTPSQSDFESANVILTGDRLAIQEKQFKKERSDWMRSLATTTTSQETWFSFDRKSLLEVLGYSGGAAKGSGGDIRKTLQQMDLRQLFIVASSSEQIYAGREYMTIHVRIKEDEFLNGLLTLMTAWKKENPSQNDIVWAKNVARNAAHGDWYLMIDEGAGDLVNITGKWHTVDSQEKILARNSISLIFGMGLSSSLMSGKIPEDALDVTPALFPKKQGTLPSAGERSFSVPKHEQTLNDSTSTSLE